MNLLLSFFPFFVFALGAHLGWTTAALAIAALCSLGLLLRDRLAGRSVKILELGTFILFLALAAFTWATKFEWTIPLVRLAVDAGLLAIVLISLAIRRPFTLQYAREGTSPDIWGKPQFMAANVRITLVWAAAFAVLVLADAGMAFVPQIPHGALILVTVAALVVAFKQTPRGARA